jgi:hypothetical protein
MVIVRHMGVDFHNGVVVLSVYGFLGDTGFDGPVPD